ncbi:hypothetical protein CSC70_03165 [Pseudoxanthomonas kalamensis DSM 18571]|nr:hypothetical protein CSC70_03165 [Pseudoxanthomonas kalamensis DSM 18571]
MSRSIGVALILLLHGLYGLIFAVTAFILLLVNHRRKGVSLSPAWYALTLHGIVVGLLILVLIFGKE